MSWCEARTRHVHKTQFFLPLCPQTSPVVSWFYSDSDEMSPFLVCRGTGRTRRPCLMRVSCSCPRSAPLVTGNRWNGSQKEETHFQISLNSVWNFPPLLKFALCLTCLSSLLCTDIYSDTTENGSFFSSLAINWIFYGCWSTKDIWGHRLTL